MFAPNSLYGRFLPPYTHEYVLAYANLNLSILPVHGIVREICTCGKDCGRNAGKHPIARLVKRGVKDAATRRDTLSSWWHT